MHALCMQGFKPMRIVSVTHFTSGFANYLVCFTEADFIIDMLFIVPQAYRFHSVSLLTIDFSREYGIRP